MIQWLATIPWGHSNVTKQIYFLLIFNYFFHNLNFIYIVSNRYIKFVWINFSYSPNILLLLLLIYKTFLEFNLET